MDHLPLDTLIILGTSRNDSNTLKALQSQFDLKNAELVELHQLKIEPYTYDLQKPEDDFLKIANKMKSTDHILFATPVYWYSMSGTLKVFFDRLTDLITTYKPIGKALAGRSVSVFCTGSDSKLPIGFEEPFKLTSEYFDMRYMGSTYVQIK